MKLVTPKQMNDIDAYAINKLGIPGIVLMENAALKVVEEITAMIGSVVGKNILLFAGKGNNGGDAFAAARHLHCRGALVRILVLARKSEIGGDAAINLEILGKMGLQVDEIIEKQQLPGLSNVIGDAGLIIDGIFGTGLKGNVTGLPADIIDMINKSARPVLSIDIPSGVSGETGKVLGCCIKAERTVTFCLPKIGLAIHPGCEYTGRLTVADMGIPGEAVEQTGSAVNIIDAGFVSGVIPKRVENSSKGDYGKVFILTGSEGMTGSGCLCACAAMRTGAGLVYVGVPAGLAPVYGSALREPVIIPLDDMDCGRISRGSKVQIKNWMDRVNVIAAGPGLSVSDDIQDVIGFIIKESRVPLVLDADALNAVSKNISVLNELGTDAVITPHPGEMARLAGISTEEVQNDRIGTAVGFARKWGVITVLKGSRTVIALPDGTVYVNTCGNPGMATAGSGDVLTGIIAGLIGQGVGPADAAAAGVYLHGLAGDAAACVMGQHGMIAGDMVEMLPGVVKNTIEGGRNGL